MFSGGYAEAGLPRLLHIAQILHVVAKNLVSDRHNVVTATLCAQKDVQPRFDITVDEPPDSLFRSLIQINNKYCGISLGFDENTFVTFQDKKASFNSLVITLAAILSLDPSQDAIDIRPKRNYVFISDARNRWRVLHTDLSPLRTSLSRRD
jgi:hypothetical protein